MTQLVGFHFARPIVALIEFGDAALVDIKANDWRTGARERYRNWQPHIAEPNDGDLTPVFHRCVPLKR